MSRSAAATREHVLAVAASCSTGMASGRPASTGWPPRRRGAHHLDRVFASKDDLIGAYIERADRLYRDWFEAAARTGGAEPGQQILAVFDALTEQVQPGQCRGCPFLMALAEFPDPAHPAHRNAVALKAWVGPGSANSPLLSVPPAPATRRRSPTSWRW